MAVMNLYKYASLYNANLVFKQSTATGRSQKFKRTNPALTYRDYPCHFKFKYSQRYPLNLYLINNVEDIFGIFSLKCS